MGKKGKGRGGGGGGGGGDQGRPGQAPQAQPPQGQVPQAQNRQGQGPQAQRPQGQVPQGQAPQAQRRQSQGPQAQHPQGQGPQGQGPQGRGRGLPAQHPQGQGPQGQHPQGRGRGSSAPHLQGQGPQGQRPPGQWPQAQQPQSQGPQGHHTQHPQGQGPQGQRPQGSGGPAAHSPSGYPTGQVLQPPVESAPVCVPQTPSAGDTSKATTASQAPAPAKQVSAGKRFTIPQRTNCAQSQKDGKPIKLEVNHLLLQVRDIKTMIYHYDVTIDPDKPKRFLRPVMQEMRDKFYPQSHPGFDGRKNLYSKGPLPFGEQLSKEVKVVDDERSDKAPKAFKVTIKLARSNISLQELFAYQAHGRSTNPPQDVIQAVDVILRSGSAKHFVQVGRSFFCRPTNPHDLSSGMELWLGFFQSFIMGHRPYLNIDVAHKGFPKEQSLLDLLCAMAPYGRDYDDCMYQKKNDFERFIKGLKIEYKIPNIESSKRTYRVNGLRNNAMQERFQKGDGQTITIGEYFQNEKNYKLRYPTLPCVHVGPREKNVIVPLELCVLIGGQPTMKKLDEQQTANMVRAAATNVADRKRKIRDAMSKANLNSSPEVREFGLSIAQDFAKVDGRILPPPVLGYERGRTVTPAKGVWRGLPFKSSNHLQKWIVVVTCRMERDSVQAFADGLRAEAARMNMQMERYAPPIYLNCPPQRLKMELKNNLDGLHREQYELILVVIAGNNKQVYGQVKQVAELQVGVLTQCVKDVTVKKRNNPATLHNILLKINAKFNGVNQVLADHSRLPCLNNQVLLLGADVTHPSPDCKDVPSVAAVTASHDLNAFKYNTRIRLQDPREEIIRDLANIVCEQLAQFKNETGCLPKHIIFYRDGVSEGQFQQVLDQELQAIRTACIMQRQKGYQPKMTFLVVQKRHHTRFFPMDNRVSEDRNGNVPAGTIVDTEITHPTEIDFYLVSHASIQGVARPTKYHVLWDDSHMSENEIHNLTYGLCHLFTRCDRSVSYPAPTYYAHLAASRGRVYLEGINVNVEDLEREAQRIQTAVNFTNRSPMYFV